MASREALLKVQPRFTINRYREMYAASPPAFFELVDRHRLEARLLAADVHQLPDRSNGLAAVGAGRNVENGPGLHASLELVELLVQVLLDIRPIGVA